MAESKQTSWSETPEQHWFIHEMYKEDALADEYFSSDIRPKIRTSALEIRNRYTQLGI